MKYRSRNKMLYVQKGYEIEVENQVDSTVQALNDQMGIVGTPYAIEMDVIESEVDRLHFDFDLATKDFKDWINDKSVYIDSYDTTLPPPSSPIATTKIHPSTTMRQMDSESNNVYGAEPLFKFKNIVVLKNAVSNFVGPKPVFGIVRDGTIPPITDDKTQHEFTITIKEEPRILRNLPLQSLIGMRMVTSYKVKAFIPNMG